jgi:hypothetical protein
MPLIYSAPHVFARECRPVTFCVQIVYSSHGFLGYGRRVRFAWLAPAVRRNLFRQFLCGDTYSTSLKQQVRPKCWYPPAKVYSVSSQHIIIQLHFTQIINIFQFPEPLLLSVQIFIGSMNKTGRIIINRRKVFKCQFVSTTSRGHPPQTCLLPPPPPTLERLLAATMQTIYIRIYTF